MQIRGKPLSFLILFLLLLCCGCDSLFKYRQPLLSQDYESIREFSDSTIFPYSASDERKTSILDNYQKIEIGMSGDEVLNIMGKPDDAGFLAFPFDPPRAWNWEYNLRKKYPNAPEEWDRFVEVFFDVDGKVQEILDKM